MKILVIGTSGSGKTTLAGLLAAKMSLPHIELDNLFWLPNWGKRPAEEFRAQVIAATRADNWVACGNHSEARTYLMERADFIVWLDYSFVRVLAQTLRRTWSNIRTKKLIAGGNRETFYRQFLTRNSIFLWVLQTHWRRRNKYSSMISAGRHPGKWVRISTRQEYERFVKEIVGDKALEALPAHDLR